MGELWIKVKESTTRLYMFAFPSFVFATRCGIVRTMLTQKAIDELKDIYRKEYGEVLADDKAWEMGNRLLRVFAVLTRLPTESRENPRVRTASRLTERGQGT